MMAKLRVAAAVIAILLGISGSSTAFAQKAGGILRVYSADSPPGLNIYEQATPWGQGPLMAVYNNLIVFDQHVPQNSLQSIVPDLATQWAWNEEGTELTFEGVADSYTASPFMITFTLEKDNLHGSTGKNEPAAPVHRKRPAASQ